jgi:CubicO group peptidase (beta-lactamase class C family)
MPGDAQWTSLGFDPHRVRAARALAESWCRDGLVPALAVILGNSRGEISWHFGRQQVGVPASAGPEQPDGGAPADPLRQDAIFLVASITKPVVATGVLLLVERGRVGLGDRVSEYLPGFARRGKAGTTLRHLLTHTSGLPDMLPNNRELRQQHAPLAAFVDGACEAQPDFPPGRGVQYQSMGFAVLGEIVHRVTGKACAEFLREELFEPLGMYDTALGAPDAWFHGSERKIDRIAEIRLPPDQQNGGDWNWNSRYWRQLGAPWGGLLTTAADLHRFARLIHSASSPARLRSSNNTAKQPGCSSLLSPATIAAATVNQLTAMRDIPEADRRCRPWGLGWRLNWPAHSANFGDLLGPRAFGHWGATGTALWFDPDRDLYALILTTQPQEPDGRYLARLSNAISAAAL